MDSIQFFASLQCSEYIFNICRLLISQKLESIVLELYLSKIQQQVVIVPNLGHDEPNFLTPTDRKAGKKLVAAVSPGTPGSKPPGSPALTRGNPLDGQSLVPPNADTKTRAKPETPHKHEDVCNPKDYNVEGSAPKPLAKNHKGCSMSLDLKAISMIDCDM